VPVIASPLPPAGRWQEIDGLFAAALERPAGERDAFVEQASGGDAELAREVRALLESEGQAAAALGDSVTAYAAPLLAAFGAELPDDARGTIAAGSRLGAYLVLDEIGRGGMGAVYLAERADEQFRKRVAIKLVKRGMDTDEVLGRFRHERQILAALEHPNIARLYDGGVTDDGRPYLVMEYVEGQPITTYCDERRLGVDERLALFATVCQAVQYAHQNLVVHRDIKPSNILVADPGEVRLLDFGIAKLLSDDAAGAAPHTRPEARVLTPDYAAPEQLLGRPVTTASDVYSLGVVLYELLTGRRPYAVAGKGMLETERVVLEGEVERPSVAVVRRDERDGHALPAVVATARGATPDRLRRRLRGDLDTITLKALAKEPERRYQSAEQLLGDLRRHAQGLPVSARRDSAGYRAGKFVRRHRAGVLAAALVLVSLAGGLGAALSQAERAARERDRARTEADKARATIEFMTGLFEGADPDESQGDTMTVFELLDRGSVQLSHSLADQPAVRATVQNVLGSLRVKLGDYDRALPLLREALATRRTLYGEGHEEVARTRRDLAYLLTRKGEYDAADSLYQLVLASERKRVGDADSAVASLLIGRGFSRAYQGKYRDARPPLEEALQILAGLPGDHRKLTAHARYGLAILLAREGDFAGAAVLLRQVLAARRELYGDLHTEVLDALEGLGNVLYNQRQYDAAEPFLREALEKRRRLLGPDHLSVATTLNNLALIPSARGDYERADSMLRESLAITEKRVGRIHRDVGMTLNNIAWAAMEKGDLDAAEAQFREALAIMEQASGKESADAALVLGNLATVQRRKGAYGESERLYRAALATRLKVHGPESMQVAWRTWHLADMLREARRYDEAERLHRESLALRRRLQGAAGPDVAEGLYGLAGVVCDRRRYAEADSLFRAALDMYASLPGDQREWVAQTRAAFGACLVAQSRHAEAEPLLVDGYAQLARAAANRRLAAHVALGNLVTLYTALGRPDKAAEYRALLASR
jgi:serine/threonine-protein kinase